MGNGNCNHIAQPRSIAVIGVELDNRMEAIFEAAGEAIYQASAKLIANYANEGVEWEHSAAACGKALVVNGISAVIASLGEMSEHDIAVLCDDVNALIAGRFLEHHEQQLAVA